MKSIKITDEQGQQYTGTIPESWDEVPLLAYSALAAATDLPSRATALAALVGLPAAPLLEDVALFAAIRQAALFLFDGPLPDKPEPEMLFEHGGISYAHVGDLQKMNSQQYEALDGMLSLLRAEKAAPITKGHELLSVLYKPATKKQTAATVAAAAEAFKTLPVSIGYPALQAFFLRNWKSAHPIQIYSVVKPQVATVLETLEQSISASQASSWSLRRWLSLTWIRRVKRAL